MTKTDTETLAQYCESAEVDTYHHGSRAREVTEALREAALRLRELEALVKALRPSTH